MKILYVTTVGITMVFFKPFVKSLLDAGHTVEIATNDAEVPVPECYREWGCVAHTIATSRSPLNRGNRVAVKQLRRLVEENRYDIVHCHTPVAAMCARLACRRARKRGTKVFYTAHGFHFFKGAPLKNWLLYYPVEKICSRWTDLLITINQEDYALAQRKMRAKKVVYVPGVGVDLTKFGNATVDRAAKRRELGVPEDATLLLSVGELNENKNHETIIRAMAKVDNANVYYAIAGRGPLQARLAEIAESLGLGDRVKVLGFRADVAELCASADIFAFPSRREGLGLAAIEAMCYGLPLITSNVHGINDYSEDGKTGFKNAPTDVVGFAESIKKLLEASPSKRKEIADHNRLLAQKYGLDQILPAMKRLYSVD